jgi:hypothetical protein
MKHFELLYRLMRGAVPLSADGEGGAHTDVFRFDRERLSQGLTRPDGTRTDAAEAVTDLLSTRYLVKKGKIEHFSMPLKGKKADDIRRSVISWVFGPTGYNFHPTWEKTCIDVSEAMRLVPYLGYGAPAQFFAPDLVDMLDAGERGLETPRNGGQVFLRTVLENATGAEDRVRSAWQVLSLDPYFHARAAGWDDVRTHQEFVRRNPLTAAMQEELGEFFEGPITVGLQDTLRWMRGSRHPAMLWTKARGVIERCFERRGLENFLLPEITYYSYDTRHTPGDIARLIERNRDAARALAFLIEAELPAALLPDWKRLGPERIAFEILDFHHDYPLYDVEPYSGFVSLSMARMFARVGAGLLLEASGAPEPDVRNTDLARAPEYLATLVGWLGSLDASHRDRVLDLLARLLGRYRAKGGFVLEGRRGLRFERIPRTFYTFQERADLGADDRPVKSLHTLSELWKPEHAGFWTRHPELSEKLTVFSVLSYRYFLETGFSPDLRPRDAGRDIFLFGVWGYSTENILITEEEVGGRLVANVRFVDNRDQFKQHRRVEDRRNPVGVAKHFLHLMTSVVEPALKRSVGVFAEQVRQAEEGQAQAPGLKDALTHPVDALDRGVDLTRKVVKSSLDTSFSATRSAVDDLIDDVHTGTKKLIRKVSAPTRSSQGRA